MYLFQYYAHVLYVKFRWSVGCQGRYINWLIIIIIMILNSVQYGDIHPIKANDVFVQTASDVEWKKLWKPKLYVDNSIGELKEDIWFTMYMSGSGEAYAVERRRVRGNFLENLELHEFPFDIQVKHCLISRSFLLVYSFKTHL